jgi:diguanylate cyclase (GGDEF)-like protein/PAS domain S-box-containing protein
VSIAKRLFALIAVTLLLVAGGELYNGLSLRHSRLEELNGDTVQRARIAALDVDRLLEGSHQLLATLAKLPETRGWDERACSMLVATVNSDFEYDHIVAVDRRGQVRCSSSGSAGRAIGIVADLAFVDRILAGNGFTVGTYGRSLGSGSEVLRVGYPVVDEARTVIGAVYAGINVTWMNTAIGQFKLGENVTINLADRNGIMLARHPDSRGVGRPVPDSWQPFLARAEMGAAELPGMDGVPRLFGYIPAAIGPSNSIAVFVGRNYENVFAGIDRSIWLNMAATLSVLLLSLLAALIFLHRFLDRPFKRLLTAATLWRGGDWSARVAGETGIPEFDRLASAFDGMAVEVSGRDRALQYRDAISHAVTECAAELVTTATIGEAIPRILKTMGEALKADRIIVLENQSVGSPLRLHDAWHGPGATFELGADYFDSLSRVEKPEVTQWLTPLRAGKIVAATRRDVYGAAREVFDTIGMVSNLQAPITVDGEPWGQLGVDDCRVERSWTSSEMDAVTVLADLIGAAIARARHLEKLSNADEVIRNSPAVLYRLAANVSPPRMTYVSDNVSLLGQDAAKLLADPGLYIANVHPDDREAAKAAIMATSTGATTGSMEFRVADASGTYRWVENRYKSRRDESGRLVEVAGVMIDVTERKSAAEKLQFANTLLTTQMETSPDAILVVDANMRIISFNSQFLKMWGLPADLVQAGSDRAVLAAVTSLVAEPEAFGSRVRYLYDHREESSHEEVTTSDGRFIDRHTSPLRTADNRYLGRVWFFRDITARRQAERALAASELRFRTILQASSDGITVVDADTRTFTLANQAVCNMIGYTLDELKSLSTDQIYVSEDRAAAELRLQRLRAGEAVLSSGVRIKRKDGSEFLADISAAPLTLEGRIYIVGTFRDVTERKRVEGELLREREFSSAVIDGLPGIFFVLDSQGRNVRFNAGLAVATGRSNTDLMGTSALRSVVELDRGLASSRILETLKRGQADVELGLLHVDGTTRRYFIKANRIELEDGPGILGIGMDVTDTRHTEKLLRESEQRFRAIFASVSDGIFVYDIGTGARVEANQSICDMFGYTRDEILKCEYGSLSSLVGLNTRQESRRLFDAACGGAAQAFEWQNKTKDGRLFFTDTTLRKITIGDRDYMLSTVHDITERKGDQEKILHLARFDGLTGLANRSVFAEALHQGIVDARRSEGSFAVLYLDLDHFKDVNDTLGHPCGDVLLKLVAERMRNTVRENDTVARFGGDEFAVMQADIQEPTDAGELAERLLDSLNQPYIVAGSEVRTGASIGIAIYGPDATDAEALLSRADMALYRAKAEGRGTYRFFTEAMDIEVRTRVSLGNDLGAAIGSNELFLEYQPQVEAASGRIVGVEALVRWRHPQRGIVPPTDFIPLAERNGLIVALGHWVLREACRQSKAWRDAGIPPVVMAVNVSSLQFKSPLVLESDIQQALAEFGLPPEMLELELTETALMDASLHHNDVLSRLRTLGVRLAIDDFGTGYSSLDYLRRFPFDRLKIAQNFIFDLGVAPGNAVIVRAAIGLARELGMAVLAEGVETEGQLKLLQKWGCPDVQGFYFSPPLGPENIEPLLRSGRIALPEPLLAT